MIYFAGPDGRQVRMVDLATLKDTLLFELPEGREALAQNACTPDGKWFLYNHAPVPTPGFKQGQAITGKHVSVRGLKEWGYYHTGWDPEGRFWFWEVRGGRLVYLKHYDETGKGQHEFADLTGEWGCSAHGQRGHYHPQLTPDRKWVLFAANEVDAGPKPAGSQIFLLDVSDLTGTDLVGEAVRKNPKLIVTEPQKRK